jgi:hypothetical protein
MDVHTMADDVVAEALGRTRRLDAVLPGTGGPAGNARLTAWTGLVLLALFLAELVTLLDVRGLISWHIAIGVLLIPPALLKTASTGWRIIRYYMRNEPYKAAGPPPMVLRILGPLVVLSTLGVLGTGLALVFMGTDAGDRAVGGLGVSMLLLHKATFVLWGVFTGVHTLGRLVPAAQLTIMRRDGATAVPGPYRRGTLLIATLLAAVLSATIILAIGNSTAWRAHRHHGQHAATR